MTLPKQLAATLFLLACHSLLAADRIHYTVSLANPEKHLINITIEIPPGPDERELQLPVWNALYQVRDFSQYMNWIRAEDSSAKPLPLMQLNKSRWRITGAGNGARVRYEMFSNDPGPYGAQLDSHHAFFNLAEILCYIEGERATPDQVEFRGVPAGWKVATSLDQHGSIFSAPNYDRLVDSPVEMSAFHELDFDAACGRYSVVLDAENADDILNKIIPPIQRIVSAETKWMDDCPLQNYTFIYHFADLAGGGGMEHAYSTAITLSPQDVSGDLDRFNSVTAHEFFHLWNVKRIRPQSLEPIDYTKENFTPALWFSEGVDSTAAGYVRLRAGLLDERRYLDHLGEEITQLENRPAHLTQSAEQSSMDAWLEKYPHYNLPTRSISYYNKGELLGVLLDLKMREASDDKVSLRDLFRWMNEHYAREGKFFADSEGVREAAEKLSHVELREFFQRYVSGTSEIPWDDFFYRVGLRVNFIPATIVDPGFEAARNFDQPLTVLQVEEGSEADRAGLKAGDVILQINGRPPARDFEKNIAELGPKAWLKLRVLRGGIQQEFRWTLGSHHEQFVRVEDVPDPTAQQKSRRAKWLFDSSVSSPNPIQ